MKSYRFKIEGIIDSWLNGDEIEHRIAIMLSDLDFEATSSKEPLSSNFELREFDNCTITQICPRDDSILESRIFDIDGTYLEEHKVCLECGYGSPALS